MCGQRCPPNEYWWYCHFYPIAQQLPKLDSNCNGSNWSGNFLDLSPRSSQNDACFALLIVGVPVPNPVFLGAAIEWPAILLERTVDSERI